MASQIIHVRLKSFDYKLIDQATKEIVDTAKRTGARVMGPIPLPTKIEKYTLPEELVSALVEMKRLGINYKCNHSNAGANKK